MSRKRQTVTSLAGFLLFPIVLIAIGVVYFSYKQTRQIADVSKPQTLLLKKLFFRGNIESIQISCGGFIDGKARIMLVRDDASKGEGFSKEEEISGNVNLHWSGDWSSDTAEIRYVPENVSEGSLTLKYRFHDL